MEVKAQQRKNRCSSDDVWSAWSAAKSGEDKRSVSFGTACVSWKALLVGQ